MELQDLVVVNVNTLDKTVSPIKVTVPAVNGAFSAENIHRKVVRQLGLQHSSFEHFSLFEENNSQCICRRFKDNDTVPVSAVKNLCVRKWCFNKVSELSLLKTDDVAAHLIYLEAENNIDEGILQPTKEQEQKLDELSEPGFVLEKQFVETCHEIKDYFTVSIKGCQVWSHPSNTDIQVQSRPEITSSNVKVTVNGLHVLSDDSSLQIPWFCVREWLIYSSEVKFRYHNSDDQEWTLSVSSDQIQYLVTSVNQMIKEYQSENSLSASFYWSMVTTADDGATLWQNAVFDLDKAKLSHVKS